MRVLLRFLSLSLLIACSSASPTVPAPAPQVSASAPATPPELTLHGPVGVGCAQWCVLNADCTDGQCSKCIGRKCLSGTP